MTVKATQGGSDSDSHTITYSIVGGNTNGAFSIDESSGEMSLASQLGINYEELTPNPIAVMVSDNHPITIILFLFKCFLFWGVVMGCGY